MEKIEIKITLSEEELQEAWSMLRDIQSTLQEINKKLDELQQKEELMDLLIPAGQQDVDQNHDRER